MDDDRTLEPRTRPRDRRGRVVARREPVVEPLALRVAVTTQRDGHGAPTQTRPDPRGGLHGAAVGLVHVEEHDRAIGGARDESVTPDPGTVGGFERDRFHRGPLDGGQRLVVERAGAAADQVGCEALTASQAAEAARSASRPAGRRASNGLLRDAAQPVRLARVPRCVGAPRDVALEQRAHLRVAAP